MKAGDITYACDTLIVIECAGCGIPFGVPTKFQARRREDKITFYCPNGHKQWYSESEADRLRRELNALRQREAMHEDDKRRLTRERDVAEAARVESERRAARVAKRISRGVCPGCNRSFPDLARHMASKHMGIECAAVQVASGKKERANAKA